MEASDGVIHVSIPYSEWTQKAYCLGVDEDGGDSYLFIPESKGKQRTEHEEMLKDDFCVFCPVRSICSDFAIENRLPGYWGYPQWWRDNRAKRFGYKPAI